MPALWEASRIRRYSGGNRPVLQCIVAFLGPSATATYYEQGQRASTFQ